MFAMKLIALTTREKAMMARGQVAVRGKVTARRKVTARGKAMNGTMVTI